MTISEGISNSTYYLKTRRKERAIETRRALRGLDKTSGYISRTKRIVILNEPPRRENTSVIVFQEAGK